MRGKTNDSYTAQFAGISFNKRINEVLANWSTIFVQWEVKRVHTVVPIVTHMISSILTDAVSRSSAVACWIPDVMSGVVVFLFHARMDAVDVAEVLVSSSTESVFVPGRSSQ